MSGFRPEGAGFQDLQEQVLPEPVWQSMTRLLEQDGYHALTVAAVARDSGTDLAELAERWPTRLDLVRAAAASGVVACYTETDSGSTTADLHDLFDALANLMQGSHPAALTELLSVAQRDSAVAEVMREVTITALRDRLSVILDRARKRGEAPTVDAESAARLVFGSIMSTASFDSADEADSGGVAVLSAATRTLLISAIIGPDPIQE